MLQYIPLAIGVFTAYIAIDWFLCFRRHLNAAKASGIKYKIVPVFFLHRFWLIFHRLFLPLLAKLPPAWTEWVDFCLPEFSFDYRYEIFERVGADTFFTVSPGGNSFWTADPAVITQITTRRNDFPKPTHIYKSVDIYGKNVVSSEGSEWRYHRKATSPPFTEKNNHIVWTESINQAEAMLKSWVGPDGKGNRTVDRIMDDTMRLALHVISKAGFGRHLEWPTDQTKSKIDKDYIDPSKIENTVSSEEAEKGHTMSYSYAIHCLLDNILLQFLLPRWLMQKIPLKITKKAEEAYVEWGNYMRDMVAEKKESVASGGTVTDNDILGQLVKGQLAEANNEKSAKKSTAAPALTDEHILGNSFVLILAGHETAANSIHFALLYLAMDIPSQRKLQKDLDEIFEGKPPSEWDYERDLPALFGGMVGAVLNEELRLVPPVVNIPKSCTVDKDQPLKVDGKDCLVPRGTYMSLCTAAVQRNPKYWAVNPPGNPGGRPVHPKSNVNNDMEEFRPERWLLSTESNGSTNTNGHANGSSKKEVKMVKEQLDNEGLSVNLSSDTSDHLFHPVKGSYVPFSEGYRACLGRRFAQVEILVTLAVIFQKYSVELAVDEFASDEEVVRMGADERSEVWGKAADRCRELMRDGMGVIITLQMRQGTVSVRLVPRGQERFPEDADIRARKMKKAKGEKVLFPGEKAQKQVGWRCWDKQTWKEGVTPYGMAANVKKEVVVGK
jgi:cytochrome P450